MNDDGGGFGVAVADAAVSVVARARVPTNEPERAAPIIPGIIFQS